MHERTERLLCRLAFVLFCAFPTLVTLAIILTTWTPWYDRMRIAAAEETLQQLLGVRITIGRLQKPEPGVWQLEDVVVHHPETGEESARVRTIYYVRAAGKTNIFLSQPELQMRQLALLWKLAHDRLLCQPDLLGEPTMVRAQDVSLLDAERGLTLTPLTLWIDPEAAKTTATVQFQLAGAPGKSDPVVLRVQRTRESIQPRTLWSLETGRTPLPCSVLGGYLPIMRRLGPDALFSGVLQWELEGEDYTVQILNSRFSQVNLIDLTEPLDFQVSGIGDVEITRLTRHSGGPVVEAIGKLVIQNGKVDSTVVERLSGLTKTEIDRNAFSDGQRMDCQLIALGFALHGPEVRLHGLGYQHRGFEHMPPGTVVVAGNRWAVRIDPQSMVATDALSQSLDTSGRSGVQRQLGSSKPWAHQLFPQLSDDTWKPTQGPTNSMDGSSAVIEDDRSPRVPRVGAVRLNSEEAR